MLLKSAVNHFHLSVTVCKAFLAQIVSILLLVQVSKVKIQVVQLGKAVKSGLSFLQVVQAVNVILFI